MAYFKYQSEIDTDCLISSFRNTLEQIGLNISNEFSSHAQVFAEENIYNINYKSKVNVLISWSDKSKRECSVEVRSDDPYLRRDTHCERISSQLRKLIPPKEVSSLLTTAQD